MARRSSPIRRMRREKMAEAESANTSSTQKAFDELVQALNMVDIQNRVIQSGRRRLPLAIATVALIITGIAAFVVLTGRRPSIAALFLMAVAASQFYGPFGIFTRRQAAREKVVTYLNKAAELLPVVSTDTALYGFGVKKVGKEGVELSSKPERISNTMLNGVDHDGKFPFDKYRYLGLAVAGDTGDLQFDYRDLAKMNWVRAAKTKTLSADYIRGTLNT